MKKHGKLKERTLLRSYVGMESVLSGLVGITSGLGGEGDLISISSKWAENIWSSSKAWTINSRNHELSDYD